MLNLSPNTIDRRRLLGYSAFGEIMTINKTKKITYWLLAIGILVIVIVFLPWTQNIVTKGKVTTLRPEQRPQSVFSTIPGRIEVWYVREGETVKAGDTLAYLSEIKSDYLDDQLLQRTQAQVDAKQASRRAYGEKADALGEQLNAIGQALRFKLEQTQNKVKQYGFKATADSMAVDASQTAYQVALNQYNRTDTLYQQGIKSLTDVENKRNKLQETTAKLIANQNKYLSTKNELLNAQIELSTIQSEYANKMAKVRSDRSSALSNRFDAESQLAKLEIQYASYERRSQFYYIIAPQSGYITKIHKKGIGELAKETEPLLSIMPENPELAIETYVRPMDYPLLKNGQIALLVFDGWPAFVFSGWPNQSYGAFRGKVIAVDNVANENGLYRILILPYEESNKPWPIELRVGTGAQVSLLLNDVPLWYEFWRQLNGFPPDYYEEGAMEKVKLKAPANNLKK